MSEEGLDRRKPGGGEAQADYDDLGGDAARLMSNEPGGQMGEEKRAARADTMAWLRGAVGKGFYSRVRCGEGGHPMLT